MELTDILMELLTSVSGSKISKMEKDSKTGQMALNMRESTETAKRMETVSSDLPTEVDTQEPSKIMRFGA